jgi:glycosyltransferase involved in cell wall biosynthesis
MTESLPLISIVTPTYNQARYLAETIASVLAQDYPHIEYIVINDGSSDETPAVMDSYGDRIVGLHQANMGQALTLNKGWAMARGKYVGYLSSDDLLFPHAISRLVKVLESRPEVVVAYPDADLIDPSSRVILRNVAREFDYDALVVQQDCHIGPGALFRKSLVEQLGGWRADLRLAPDREFWMRAGLQGDFHMIQETLAGYRMHPESISYYDTNPNTAKEYLRVLDDYYARPDVPERLISRKGEAYANAQLILCRMLLRDGRFSEALYHYREAVRLNPKLPRLQTWARLIRTSVSKPIRKWMWQIKRTFSVVK